MPPRVLLTLEDVSLSFGGKPLFEELNLHIVENDKICLVGKNGAGKTTLMRLITEELELDKGTRFVYPGLSIGYLAQKVEFNPEETVKQFVMSGLTELQRTEERHYQADIVIAPLDIDPDAIMKTLSGGQLRRAALARALVSEPDILLLDEPTNHLDLGAIEWLEQFLSQYKGAVVCVSHDRAFLTTISRKVFWIDRGAVKTCPFGYANFDNWMEQVVEQEARELHNLQRKMMAEIDWTQGGVTGRRKRNQRRMRELERMREKLRNDKAAYRQRIATIELDPMTPVQASKRVAEFRGVSKSFDRNGTSIPILKDFNLRIMRGDRIGVIGKNGSGKSTFLKLLVKEMEADKGSVLLGKSIAISYFDQNRVQLDPNKTLWETLCPQGGDRVLLQAGEEEKSKHVCAYLKDFLFDPKIARDKVATLSGGQQNRLMLAKLLTNPGNVLILDEPTNDLDMDTLDMLQEVLSEYKGTLLLVSHDRDFLDRTVTEVIAFEGNAVVEGYLGGYTDYVTAKNKPVTPPKSSPLAPPKAAEAAPSPAPVSKLSYKYKHELEQMPNKIAALDEELEQLRLLMDDAELYTRDPEAFDKAMRRYGEAQKELDAAEIRWLELEEMALAAQG